MIEFGKVQSKVMLKFDNWHKEVLTSFGKLLNDQMIGFHREIAKVRLSPPQTGCLCVGSQLTLSPPRLQARTDLETQSLETSSTSDAVHLITYVQNLKRKHTVWDQLVGVSN